MTEEKREGKTTFSDKHLPRHSKHLRQIPPGKRKRKKKRKGFAGDAEANPETGREKIFTTIGKRKNEHFWLIISKHGL